MAEKWTLSHADRWNFAHGQDAGADILQKDFAACIIDVKKQAKT